MRYHVVRPLGVLLALMLVASACGGSDSSASDVALAEDGTFTATALDGEPLVQADYAGQDVMLWFWAPW